MTNEISSPTVSSDAEKLVMCFVSDIARAPFRVAPEKAHDLAQVANEDWSIDFGEDKTNFTAYPDEKIIKCSYSAILSVWATCRATILIADAALRSTKAKKSSLDLTEPSLKEALALVGMAKALVRNPREKWPDELPRPCAVPNTNEERQENNHFLASIAWLLLHEIAHIYFDHKAGLLFPDERKTQERQADRWATEWMLDRVPNLAHRRSRVFSVASALTWVGLVDDVRRGGNSHPHSSERLIHCAKYFHDDSDQDNPGILLSAYVIKAIFEPTYPVKEVETIADAFDESLILWSHRDR